MSGAQGFLHHGVDRNDELVSIDAADRGRTPESAEAMLRAKQPDCVSFADWRVLDRLELDNGKKAGKAREKITSIREMLAGQAEA